jgi:pimeloyl-ACP methyl ester carboxylesterase
MVVLFAPPLATSAAPCSYYMSMRSRCSLFIISLFSVIARAAHGQDTGSALAERAATLLGSNASLQAMRTTSDRSANYSRFTLAIRDESYPLTVDIVGDATAIVTKVVYMLPGGSTNFSGSFFTPRAHNLALFLAARGCLVVGVTAREDNVPSTASDLSRLQDWGLAKHSADLRSLVLPLQAAFGLPYEVLGHSYGAATALDYAARYRETTGPERVIALDIYSLDGEGDPNARRDAERTYDAHAQLLTQGQYVDDTYAVLKPAQALAVSAPRLDSGVSRSSFGQQGTFHFEGLFFANLIDSSDADGVHSSITGLKGDWLFAGGTVAGRYMFADDPADDRYVFTHSSLTDVMDSVRVVGSGLIAVALERDVWGANAGKGYDLDWGTISQPVIWINSEFGYGVHRHAAKRMRAHGNAKVIDDLLQGYGHGDMLWARTAELDLWKRLVP